ncbi:enoyl-CoA delta isomerase 2-like [Uranotaenia lowii]|uniref:enoyl-CoA delta isomerase 2-like n=1 Tax=Uranotaenia lowii TaxID=190385 RepID=UPI00247AC9BA|nr:enoyl-CoA delta isomerase 2-like [Uranotaenia lowii]
MPESAIRIPHIRVENLGTIRKITTGQLQRHNGAFNVQTFRELSACLAVTDRDPAVHAVVLIGAGEWFCSGLAYGDLLEAGTLGAVEAFGRELTNVVRSFYKFSKLIICVVNGPAVGIGASIALLCDVIFMEKKAYLQTPLVSELGTAAVGCSSYTFPRLMGYQKASQMLLLNYRMTADEAHQQSIVAELYDSATFESTLWPKLVDLVGTLSMETMQSIKQQIKRFDMDNLDRANTREADALVQRLNRISGLKSKI